MYNSDLGRTPTIGISKGDGSTYTESIYHGDRIWSDYVGTSFWESAAHHKR